MNMRRRKDCKGKGQHPPSSNGSVTAAAVAPKAMADICGHLPSLAVSVKLNEWQRKGKYRE
jgi:hypothetical protein